MSQPIYEIRTVWTCDACQRQQTGAVWGEKPGGTLPDGLALLNDSRTWLPEHWTGEYGGTFCGTRCMCAWAARKGDQP